MSGRVGRDRFRRDHVQNQQPHHISFTSSSSSFSPLRPSSRAKNAPSRHLWVGNLAHHITESALSDHFVRFGELESLAFHTGRSYAFINFVRRDDAMAALNSLQGFNLAGLPLRIEFAKDKSSPPRHESCLQSRDEPQPQNRNSTFSKRESRICYTSPDAFYSDTSRRANYGSDHPSEILWIGFPSFLKVEETLLRKAFSPFGEIEKITAFPGRTYAFVQFRTLGSACRAKETLQGKLFGNPRVHICFARSDTASSSGGGRRGVGTNASPSAHFMHSGRATSSGKFCPDPENISGDSSIRPRHYFNKEYEDHDVASFSRKEPSWTCGNGEENRSLEFGPDVGLRRGLEGYHNSPTIDETGCAQSHHFSPQRFPRKSPFRDDQWDSPEGINVYHGAKKLKVGSFPHDELPEYPLHSAEEGNILPRMLPDLPVLRQSDETGPVPYKRIPDSPVKFNLPSEDMHDWRSSHDALQSPLPLSTPLDWRSTPELCQQASKEWKWEGTIAKGGTPVCRARCFPVGRVMDIFLPQFLDCTARTGLDMLAKHYHQAAGSWVVFFVPSSDADIGYYNEFLHYLGEKQRAAVSKLDERNTLFLVPPSDFSEKILKVPGKLSISGVVLTLEPASSSVHTLPPANETKDTSHMYPYSDTSYQKLDPRSVPLQSFTSYPIMEKPGICSPSSQGNVLKSAPLISGYGHTSGSVLHVDKRYDFEGCDHTEDRRNIKITHHSTLGPTWSPYPPQTSVGSCMDLYAFPITPEYHHFVSGSNGPEPNVGNYKNGYFGMSHPGGSKSSLHEQKFQASVTFPPGHLQPQQHPEFLPSPLRPPGQCVSSPSVSTTEDSRSSSVMGIPPENPSKLPSRYTASKINQMVTDKSTSQFHHLQQPLQAEIVQGVSHAAVAASRGTPEVLTMGDARDEGEGDPQKRLQATLKLAAALLQQIQQGKGG